MNKINFTYKVKKEICNNIIQNSDLKYVVAGILFDLIYQTTDCIDFCYLSSNFDVIKILKIYFNNSEIIKQKTKCEILFKLNQDIINIIEEICFLDVDKIILFFSGLFLSSGSITDPAKSYHFEIRVSNNNGDFVKKIFKKLNIKFFETKHNNKIVIYIKKNEIISDILKLLKANECMFYFEECKISKDFNISMQRINNLDISNINKQIKGSQKIIFIINFLSNTNIFNKLDPIIIEYCKERKKYPEYSIKQIADNLNLRLNKKITKSWINHVNIKLRNLFLKYK